MFETSYQILSAENPKWGTIAILPWDTDIFGFPVAEFKAGDCVAVAEQRTAFEHLLTNWASTHAVELIACSISGDDARWRVLLPQLGFTFVDYALTAMLTKLQAVNLPPTRVPIREASREDQAEVERIAEHAFRAGRYHADPRFPRELADLRYRCWLGNAFASLGPKSHMYLTGEPGNITGFCHINLDGDRAYITILGVDPEFQNGTTPFGLFIGTLAQLKRAGVRHVSSKLSAMNTPIMNLAAFVGARFSQPQAIFHWHAPGAPHLVPLEAVYS